LSNYCQTLKEGKVLVEYGPVFMVIEAYSSGAPITKAALAGGKKAVQLLDELSGHLEVARKPAPLVEPNEAYPQVLNLMISKVKVLRDEEYTPMAAVAGAFSDLVKQEVTEKGGRTVIVNNGGDISLEIEEGRSIKAGIIRDLATGECSHTLEVTSFSGIKGIATSGFGGRSLTKGVASAVSTFSNSCALADVAATAIANATYVDNSQVDRCKAEELDYHTDLTGQLVTNWVGELDEKAKEAALTRGFQRAQELYKESIINGVAIYVKDKEAMLPKNILRHRK